VHARPMLALAIAALAIPLTASAFVPLTPAEEAVVVRAQCTGATCTFDPAVVTIAPGETVQWRIVNICHSATAGLDSATESVEGNVAGMNAFDSGELCGTGTTYSHTFAAAGAYPYYCNVGLHRVVGMRGVVVVA
jgi:plastocyanin